MKRGIAHAVASMPKGSPLSFYEELSPDYYSATSKTFGGQVLKLLGLKDIADAAGKSRLGLSEALGRVHRRGEPRPDRARRYEVLRPDSRQGGSPAGLEHDSPPSATGVSSR